MKILAQKRREEKWKYWHRETKKRGRYWKDKDCFCHNSVSSSRVLGLLKFTSCRRSQYLLAFILQALIHLNLRDHVWPFTLNFVGRLWTSLLQLPSSSLAFLFELLWSLLTVLPETLKLSLETTFKCLRWFCNTKLVLRKYLAK